MRWWKAPRRGVAAPWLRVLPLGVTVILLGAVAAAQGQTPSSPIPRPGNQDVEVQDPPGPRQPGAPIPRQPQQQQPDSLQDPRSRPGARQGLDDTRRRPGDSLRDAGASTGLGTAEAEQVRQQPARPTRPAAGAASGGARTVGGGGRGGGGAPTMTRGTGAAVSVVGEGNFEPVFERPLLYGDPPDEGLTIEYLSGPMTVNEFLATIHEATGWDILATPSVQDIMLSFWIIDKQPRQALEILKFHEVFYTYGQDTNFLYVMTPGEWLDEEFGKPNYVELQVQHAEVAYIESVLTSLMSAVGRMVVDQRTGRIFLWDTADNLEQMTMTVEKLDVPLLRREFMVRNADVPDIESVLTGMLSPNGSILADGRTGQILVWDAPNVLTQMDDAVMRLDVPVQSRTFEIAYVSAEDVVDSLEVLLSERGMIQVDPRFNTLIVSDMPSRLDRMAEIIDTLDRKLETRTWVINHADIDFIADQIETLIPAEMGNIVVNFEAHQITVTGLTSRLDQIDELIQTWDVERSQVLIEAYIVEVGTEVARQFNINWSYIDSLGSTPIRFNANDGFGGDTIGSGSPLSLGQLPYAVPMYGALQLDNGRITRPLLTDIEGNQIIDRIRGNSVAATIEYLDQQNKATVLSSPRITVRDGEEATFESVTQVPFISSTSIFNQTGFNNINNTNRVEFIDVGTVLSVLPRVSEVGSIVLDLVAEDSDFIDKEIVSNNQVSTIPQKTVRQAQTQVQVRSGDTIVLGGLRRDRASKNVTKTPFLGDIPMVGRLFKNPRREARNNTLLIFITTTIVDDRTHPEAEILANATESIADSMRYNKKDFWGRMQDRASAGENEIAVAIGQGGDLHANGRRTSLQDLRQQFVDLGRRAVRTTVVIRRHPRAPMEPVTYITEAAMELGMKVTFDDEVVPIIPSYSQQVVDAKTLENTAAQSLR